jgi:hypothetical protein
MVLSESVGTERMRTNTQFCGIFTFAILSHLSVVLDAGKHLGENHQKRVIPAAYLKRGANEKARHEGGPSRMTDPIVKRHSNCLNHRGRGSSYVAICPELLREFVRRSG